MLCFAKREITLGLLDYVAAQEAHAIDRAQYCEMNRKMQLALVPGTAPVEAAASAAEDWADDSRGLALMPKAWPPPPPRPRHRRRGRCGGLAGCPSPRERGST